MPAPRSIGPRQRTTTGRNRVSVRNIASKDGNIRTALDRDRTTGIGGQVNRPGTSEGTERPSVSPTPFSPQESLQQLKQLREKQQAQTALQTVQLGQAPATSGLETMTKAVSTAQTAQANLTALALASMYRQGRGGQAGTPPRGSGGPILEQLRRGFAAAGDSRMARFVRRNPELMKVWLGQESGLRPGAISPPNNQGDPNYGLFQFARIDPGARPWLERFIKGPGAGRFTASPYQQAILAARHFDLTPKDVRRYVQQIRAGNYPGWG